MNVILEALSIWMETARLTLASHKSESIPLTTRKKLKLIYITLERSLMGNSESVRYVGFHLDNDLKGT